ncbi:unnamed protein product [Orchesella dallaii]|uniref:Uncharacterized protein n=1 Tax=Orchesella dallaii TaxID=48710 RepID=A0ABP1QYB2_9HEXA
MALFAQSVDRLELNSELEIFKKSSVSVVVNHLHLDQNDKSMGSYETGPFNFPVIRSLIRYKRVKITKPTMSTKLPAHRFYCDNKKVELEPNQGFYFYAPPDPKSYCFVQVYIAPKPCQQWDHTGRLPMTRSKVQSLLPDSFLNPIFDIRTSFKDENENDFYFEKANLIFIYVQKKPEKECFVYAGSIFTLVEYL